MLSNESEVVPNTEINQRVPGAFGTFHPKCTVSLHEEEPAQKNISKEREKKGKT